MKKVLAFALTLILVFSFLKAQSEQPVTSGLKKSSAKNDTSINIEKAKEVMQIITVLLEGYNYDAHALNDGASKKIFELYLKRLDPGKYLLLEEDIAELRKSETLLDDEIKSVSFSVTNKAYEIRKKRIEQVESIHKRIFAEKINISKQFSLLKDPDDLAWCKTIEDLEKRWEQIINQMLLNTYISMLIEKSMVAGNPKSDKAKENLDTEKENPLTGEIESVEDDKKMVDYSKLSKLPLDEEKLNDAISKVKKNLGVRFKRINDEGEVGNFNSYMNALCGAYDPHTAYHLPEEKESFDIELTGTLTGIGAQLQEDGDEVSVTKIIPGSASWKQKQLEVKDVIFKVAQGDQPAVDIRGMSLSESVRLIRGKKGTEVRLTVKKPDGQIVIIPIIRDIVVLEDSYTHSVIVDDKVTGQKIGYILLPSFYLEQENGNGRSCATDVKKDLIALRNKGVDGIVFDLRNNGGGSLKDVVDMAGFFIKSGPIVQVRGPNGFRKVLEDPDNEVIYSGPLVVMVSNFSASASEIFAAALQDYGRAVVLGSGLSSFGKGTVQTFVPLSEQTKNKNFDIGALRLTIQKFYRINGQTTQWRGVLPDIVLPVESMYIDIGEKFLQYPLAADLFLPTNYEKWEKGPNITKLAELSKKRISENQYFNKINEYALFLKSRREEKSINVSLADNFKELEEGQKKNKELKPFKEAKRDLSISRVTAVHAEGGGMFKEIESFLPKDQYIFEAMNIIKDIRTTK